MTDILILAHFFGIVNKFNPPPELSYVTLKDAQTGKTVDTDAVSEKLLEKGIDHDGCKFEIIIKDLGEGKTEVVFFKVDASSNTDWNMSTAHDPEGSGLA